MPVAQRSSYDEQKVISHLEYRMNLIPTTENSIIFDYKTVHNKVEAYIKKKKLALIEPKREQPQAVFFIASEIYTKTGASIESYILKGTKMHVLIVYFFSTQKKSEKELSEKTKDALAIAREILS